MASAQIAAARSDGAERGSAIVVALLLMAVLMLLGGAFLTTSVTESAIAANQVSTTRAFHLAEAGIEHAKLALETADVDALLQGDGVLIADQSLGQGTYSVTVANNGGDSGGASSDTDGVLVVTSAARYRKATRSLRVSVQRDSGPAYEWAAFGHEYVSAHGSGDFLGNVGSNGNIVLFADVIGDASAGGVVQNPARVSGTVTNFAPRLYLDLLHCPEGPYGPSPLGPGVVFNPLSGDLSISGDADTWFPAGTYFFNDFGKVGNGRLLVQPGGAVEIYVKDELLLRGGGFDNQSLSADNLGLLSCSPNDAIPGAAPDWIFDTDPAVQHMVIYAPTSRLRMFNRGDIIGTAVGKSIFKNSNGSVIHDAALSEGGAGAYGIIPGSWSELGH